MPSEWRKPGHGYVGQGIGSKSEAFYSTSENLGGGEQPPIKRPPELLLPIFIVGRGAFYCYIGAL